MNIFILDDNPIKAAQYLFDKYVVKMALETAQILSTINGGPYRPTHANHPCVKWAGECIENYLWTFAHGVAICNEYTYRYGKIHKSEEVIRSLATPLINIKEGRTDFVQCMPDEYKQKDPIEAYRIYYKTKTSFAKWTKREKPEWW
jgi:hypothetical protein